MNKDNNCCCGGETEEKENCCTDNHKEESCCGENEGHKIEDECGCGCGCDHEHEEDDSDEDKILVTFEDGEEKECYVLGIVEVDEKEYIALLPEDQENYYIYGYKEYEDGFELTTIESDEEFEMVGNVFEELFEQEM